jgi:intracellular sulfur oxidation DsrE/DsrF family protein
MHLSAGRIRTINRSIARVNGIICGASDKSHRVPPEDMKPVVSVNPASVVKIIAVPKPATA